MTTLYYPNATNVTKASSVWAIAVLSTTDAAPIVVQTVSAHGLQTGDCVENVGLVDPAACGTFQILVIDSTHFSLTGSTGTVAGGQAGNVRCVSLNPTSVALPADGTDLVDATSVNVGFEQAFDPVPYLYQAVGKYRLVDIYEIDNHLSYTPWVNSGGTPGNTAIAALNTPQAITPSFWSAGFPGYTNPPGLPASATADILDIALISDVTITCGGVFLAPAYAMQVGIGIAFGGGAFGLMPSTLVTLAPDTAAGGYIAATTYHGTVHMRGTVSATFEPFFAVCMMANMYNIGSGAPAATVKITPTGIYRCQVTHYRGNV